MELEYLFEKGSLLAFAAADQIALIAFQSGGGAWHDLWLTYGGEHGGGEVEGAGELPLDACLVRHALDHHGGDDAKVLVADIVFLLEHPLE